MLEAGERLLWIETPGNLEIDPEGGQDRRASGEREGEREMFRLRIVAIFREVQGSRLTQCK